MRLLFWDGKVSRLQSKLVPTWWLDMVTFIWILSCDHSGLCWLTAYMTYTNSPEPGSWQWFIILNIVKVTKVKDREGLCWLRRFTFRRTLVTLCWWWLQTIVNGFKIKMGSLAKITWWFQPVFSKCFIVP